MNTDLRKLGMNKETAKLTWEHLSKSGPAAAVAISATLLYFAGTVWSCLGCGRHPRARRPSWRSAWTSTRSARARDREPLRPERHGGGR